MVPLFIEHKRSSGPTGVGTVTSLTAETNSSTVMGSLVGRDRRNSCWDQEEKVWGKRRPVVQQERRIPALKELS